ncbi:Rv1733c family protein [Streptomyces sp. YIM S03343]
MRAILGLWRWRRNPLRRTTDLVEAWLAFTALLLVLVGAPVVGAVVGAVAQDSFQPSVRDQREARHLVTATVRRTLGKATVEAEPDVGFAQGTAHRVPADWTAPDGTRHHGTVTTALKSPAPGDRFTFWADRHGRPVPRPLDPATATAHASLAGFGTAMLWAVLVEASRRVIVWRMVRRRYARWDRAWDKAGPDWGRTGTGC